MTYEDEVSILLVALMERSRVSSNGQRNFVTILQLLPQENGKKQWYFHRVH